MSPREPSPYGPGDNALEDGYPWDASPLPVEHDGDEPYGPDVCPNCGEEVPLVCKCRPYYSDAVAAGWTDEQIMAAIEVVF